MAEGSSVMNHVTGVVVVDMRYMSRNLLAFFGANIIFRIRHNRNWPTSL